MVRNVLNNIPFVQLKKKNKGKSSPLRTTKMLAETLEKKPIKMEGTNWRDTVFSDEKKFNVNGPDGFKNFWHDL